MVSGAIKLQDAAQYKGAVTAAWQRPRANVQAFTGDRLAPRIIMASGIAASDANV